MPDDKESKPSFWTTVPGVLTGLGAIMAASAGLLTALYTVGVIGSRNKQPDNLPHASSTAAEPSPARAIQPQQTGGVELSRDFIIGRWEVEQTNGDVSAGTTIDYDDDGTFTGRMTRFVGGQGERVQTAGQWRFQKLSKDTFRLKVRMDDGSTVTGTFRVIDQNRIHNIDQNYIAIRK
jgi:hypothetical protein